jgi:hypothetical protein
MSFSYARSDYSSFVLWRRGPYLDPRMNGRTATPAQLYALELGRSARALSVIKLKGLRHA